MFNWLRRLLGTIENSPGEVSLRGRCWRVTGDALDDPAFFRNFPLLLPADAVLVLEGGRHSKELEGFLREHQLTPALKLAVGTSWPRRPIYHVPATAAFLEELADRTEHCDVLEVCEHLHAYRDSVVLLQWYDAFSDPLYVSQLVSQDRLDRFCSALGVAYAEGDCGSEGSRPPSPEDRAR